LRSRQPRYGRERGCARGQMQKLSSVGKFHDGAKNRFGRAEYQRAANGSRGLPVRVR
jgi:hypothetical protein